MTSRKQRIHDFACGSILALAMLFILTAVVVSPVKTMLALLAVLFCLHIIHNLTS